jgi:hypothetical protein
MDFFGMGSGRTSIEVVQRYKRLWAAVIHQAIEDAKGNVSSVEDSKKKHKGHTARSLDMDFSRTIQGIQFIRFDLFSFRY